MRNLRSSSHVAALAALAALLVGSSVKAQSFANPQVEIRLAEDRTLPSDQLQYWEPELFPEGTMVGSVGFELSATPQAAAGTWVILIGHAHLPENGEQSSLRTALLTSYPWLREVETPFTVLTESGGALHDLVVKYPRFLESDIEALSDRMIKVAPGPLAAILGEATASDDGIRAWGQPFLSNQPVSEGKHRFVWRCFNEHWANAAWAPGGQSNWYWSSTFSRVREGDFITGKHLLSINRIAEALITYQGAAATGDSLAGYNFLNSVDYRTCLGLGLVINMHAISIRGHQNLSPSGSGWGNNPLITPGTFLSNGQLLGLSISEPFVINPILNSPPFAPPPAGQNFTYAISPSSAFGMYAGGSSIIATGQSARYTHARFSTAGTTKVDSPLTYLHPVTGLAIVTVPTNAVPGPVEWISVVPLPDWATIAVASVWTSIGGILEGTDAVAPLP